MPPHHVPDNPAPDRAPEQMEAPPSANPVESGWGDGQEANLQPPPVVVEPSRERRRMNLDQLENAFLMVSGGLNWTEPRGNGEVSLFQELAATLGKPDFIQTTREVLEPTALFQKFLDDAARQVCQKMVTRDSERPGSATLALWSEDPDRVREHLQGLVLHFHHRDLALDSADLAQWLWFYDSVVFMTESNLERWHAVCVALFTHPDFYTY